MKKIYSLIAILAASFAANAQTPLNTNGSLETWADPMVSPSGWFMNATQLTNGSISQQTTGAYHGSNFVKIDAPTSSYNSAGLEDITVVPGEDYTISYYYKEIGNSNARLRHWGQWRDTNGVISTTNDDFQPTIYVEDTDGEWTYISATSTAPAGATILRFNFRVYPQNNTNGGAFGIDYVTLVEGTTASSKENNITGLNIFPNPASDVLNITSDSTLEKNVQFFDMTGKKVLDVTTTSQLNVSGLTAGIYVARITEAGKTATRKIVIK